MELLCALVVDIEEGDLVPCSDRVDLTLGGTVEVAMHFKVLNELVVGDHLLEFSYLDKIVVFSVYFALSRFTGRI